MGSLANQLRQILRRLGRTPGFTAITLLTLAIGIGANTAIFSVIDGVLLKPLPYPHPEQLVGIWHTSSFEHLESFEVPPANYFIYREQNRTFQDVALYNDTKASVTGVAQPERIISLDVTDGILPMLGILPTLGRAFNRTDDLPGSPQTAILGYSYWRERFGASRAVLGHMLTVDGQPRQIIGVMPRNFHLLDYEEPALLLPMQLNRSKVALGSCCYEGMARLKPGITLAEANADLAHMLPIVSHNFPPPAGSSVEMFEQARITPNLQPLKHEIVGDIGGLLWILMGGVGIVLLIACANVANLLLVRAEGRQQELAVRAALGATRRRLAGELLVESVVLGLLGSVLGLALAYGGLRLLVMLARGLPRVEEIGINLPVLFFTLATSLFASLLTALIPIFKYTGGHAETGLHQGGRTISQGRERHRVRNALVVAQVGLAFVLLICSGLMIRTFRALTRVDLGFTSPLTVQTVRLYIPDAEVSNEESVLRMQQAIQEKIVAIPGVASVAMTSSTPMDGNNQIESLFARDRTYAVGEVPPLRYFKYVSPGLFRTLGTPLIAGRDFTWTDNYKKLPVAIVSDNFAREYWGSPVSALGKQIRENSTDSWREIIGVVADVHSNGISEAAPPTTYWPILRSQFQGDKIDVRRAISFMIRTPRAGSQGLIKEIESAVWSVDGNLPVFNFRTLEVYTKWSMARTSFTLVMLGIAGAAGLLLGIVGLYSVIAYSVAQRRKEIGIRMALGAQRDALVRMFVRQGLILTIIGLICGVAAAAGLTRLMASLLFHVSPVDPLTYCAVSISLVMTAVLASYLPARRAATVDPVETLRAE